MALDPSIALGVKPLEITNPVNQFAQMQQLQGAQQANQLNQMKMAEYERARTEEDSIRNYLANKELGAPETRNGLMQFGKTGLEYSKALVEQDKSNAALQEAKLKNATSKINLFKDALADVNTPQQAAAWLTAQHQDADLKPIVGGLRPLDQALGNIPTNPKDFADWKAKNALGMTKYIERNTMTLAEKSNLGVAQGNLDLARQNAAKPVWNEAGQGWVTPPTKGNATGTFTPIPEIKATKDQQSAIKALSSAGYNPITGEDSISKLINKSTSGGLQTLTSGAIAHIFGSSTEGRKAISALEGTANQLSIDIAGGKLGAGISNTDISFIKDALGDVANPMKPAGERLAGWEAAKARMMRTGMIPAPAGAGGAPAAAVPPTPKGVDNSIWNAMTPEERSLWK
jgi:hypothetical protein